MFKWLKENNFVISLLALVISGAQCSRSCISDYAEKSAKANPVFSYDLVTGCPFNKSKYDYYTFELENLGERDRLIVKAMVVNYKGNIIEDLCKEIEPFDCKMTEVFELDDVKIKSDDSGIPPGEKYHFSIALVSGSTFTDASFVSNTGKRIIAKENSRDTWEHSGLLGQIEEKE